MYSLLAALQLALAHPPALHFLSCIISFTSPNVELAAVLPALSFSLVPLTAAIISLITDMNDA